MDESFLAPPGEVQDWRAVLLHAAAEDTGILSGLPGTVADLAVQTACDPDALRVVLDALTAFDLIAVHADGRYHGTAHLPTEEEGAVLAHHARVIRQWAAGLDARLHGEPVQRQRSWDSREGRQRWYDALAANARPQVPAVVEACLSAVPDATTVLDLGGGHGEYAAGFAQRGLRVTLQDLPDAIDAVRDRPTIVDHDIELFGADAFERLPDGPFDVVLCAGLTHIFDAERNAELARSLARIVRPGGVAAIHTFLRGEDAMAPLFAVQMLVVGNGGTHALEDHQAWYTTAGFEPARLAPLGDGRRRLVMFTRSAGLGAPR